MERCELSGGRPTSYSPELAAEILESMANGELGIEVCSRPGMPKFGTLYGWMRRHPEFAQAYAGAREIQAHALAERAVQSGRYATAEDAQAARVRMDADKWLAARIDPRNYGDKQTIDTNVTVIMEPDQRAARIAALQARLGVVRDTAPQIDGTLVNEEPSTEPPAPEVMFVRSRQVR
jgi:hypothetical protein